MQQLGKVVYWQDQKGFGFLVCQQTGQKLFFHIRDFTQAKSRPALGDILSFSIGTDKHGRPIATALALRHPVTNLKSNQQPYIDVGYAQDVALYFRAAFLVIVIIALLFGSLPYILPLLYLEASLLTYWLYQTDKNAAIARQSQRLPEESLQMFSLIGGWPGALLAQRKLAHKRSKPLFQREFWLIVLANSLILLWLLSQYGQRFLSTLALLQ